MNALITRLRRFVRTRRRLFAAVLAAVAVWAGLTALRPPEPTTTAVLITIRELNGGGTIGAGDVQLRQLPAELLPATYLSAPEQAVGRALTVSLPAGAILLPSSVVSRDSLAAPGMAVLPVRLAATAAGLVEVGDRLDLIGTDDDESAPVASAARVVAVLTADADSGSIAPVGSGGVTVLVELRPDALAKVAAAAARGPLGFGFR